MFYGVSPGAFIRYAHSQVPVYLFLFFYSFHEVRNMRPGASLLGRIERCSQVICSIYEGGRQVVRSGTSHKAPYATWFFDKELPAAL